MTVRPDSAATFQIMQCLPIFHLISRRVSACFCCVSTPRCTQGYPPKHSAIPPVHLFSFMPSRWRQRSLRMRTSRLRDSLIHQESSNCWTLSQLFFPLPPQTLGSPWHCEPQTQTPPQQTQTYTHWQKPPYIANNTMNLLKCVKKVTKLMSKTHFIK